jgi:type IV fimbrial biogenesis protein FimT
MNTNHSRGFTLVEVMMTLAIGAIVLTIGVPSFQTYISNTRKTTAINDLRVALSLARSTAITRRQRTTVCKSNDGLTCANDDDASNWSQGWMVFSDPNIQGVRNVVGDEVDGVALTDAEEIIRMHEALPGAGTFTGNRFVKNQVSFTPQGMFDKGLGGLGGTITYSDGTGSTGALVISFGGQIRSE